MRLPLKLITLIAFAFFANTAYSQVTGYQLSEPLDLSTKGYDKLQMMHNGNTLLFHFENQKALLVKVFDKAHKEIASHKYPCQYYDINTIGNSSYIGAYEINNEAVLFIQQPYLNREALIRFRFSADDGKLIEEVITARAPGFNTPISFAVLQLPGEQGYAVLHFKSSIHHLQERSELYVYNNRHEVVRQASLQITDEDMDYLALRKLRAENNFIYCLLEMHSTDKNGQKKQSAICCRLADTDTVFHMQMVQAARGESIAYGMLSYNDYAQTENLLLHTTYLTAKSINGYTIYERNSQSYFCPFSVNEFGLQSIKPINQDKLRQMMYAKIPRDTVNNVQLYPEAMYTNKSGATMVLYQERAFIDSKKKADYNKLFRGNIGISILDDEGNELFTNVIPQKQHLFYEYGNRFMNYVQESAGFNSFVTNTRYYILINTHKDNADRQVGDSITAVENMDHSNTMCYVVDRKGQLQRSYLFGSPGADEDNCSLLSSCDYDRPSGTFAIMIRRRKGENTETRLAWCTLQP